MEQQILTNASSGNSSIVEYNGDMIEVTVDGTFNGATVTLQRRRIGGAQWVPVMDGTWTAPMVKLLQFPRRCELRLAITGGSTPSINAWM